MLNVGKCYEQDRSALALYLAEHPELKEQPEMLETFRNGWLVGRLLLREEQIEKVVTGLAQDVMALAEGCPRGGGTVDRSGEYGVICADCYADDVEDGTIK